MDASYNGAELGSFDEAINAHMDYFKREEGGDVSSSRTYGTRGTQSNTFYNEANNFRAK